MLFGRGIPKSAKSIQKAKLAAALKARVAEIDSTYLKHRTHRRDLGLEPVPRMRRRRGRKAVGAA